MTEFLGTDFLLENKYAVELYHEYAKNMPIIDYHNHLSPGDIAQDTIFSNLTQVWINGDHYKWRAMRTVGINEKYVTGNAGDQEKFQKWAFTVPYTLRNPLYHWTHMELQRYFDINSLLCPENADDIFGETQEKLQTKPFSCRNLLHKMNIEFLCTTEDPTDTLSDHRKITNEGLKMSVSTAFRPDKALAIETEGYLGYIEQLGAADNRSITSYDELCETLSNRIRFFHNNGCRISDHGLPHLYAEDFTHNEITTIFKKKYQGSPISEIETNKFKSALLQFLSKEYHSLGWVQQFHLGALRNNNTRKFGQLGPDTGWDSIGDWSQAASLSGFLNKLDSTDQLCKTIIYNLNPRDNEIMASMIGNFNDGSIKGKLQFGSGWWFLDQKDGMTKQINALSNIGLLSCFIGMLTDSRSFLSFPRHEYFRRILCNLFGKEIENGQLPNDMSWIGKIIQDISYNNAKSYFNL
ncbi:glucuronate isomerase [Maribacter sp. 2304DJ31-5]|uniref:glucuronate isomerase n=1 Tax=Maribacter sp. 2304DJ31-5 TaxID=3386273 RepID=UPI0039BD562A